MSRAPVLAFALAATCGVPAVRAQALRGRDAPLRSLLARAESLQSQIDRRDSLAKRQQYRERLARRFSAGAVTVLMAGSVGDVTGNRMASGAAAYLDSLGAIPSRFIASHVVVALAAMGVDSVLRAEGLADHTRMMVDISANPDTLANGLAVAALWGRAYWETLDGEWRGWASPYLALGWLMARDGEAARRELMNADTRVGEECLEGQVAGCRLWLGLDRDAHPFAVRYRPSELRRIISPRMWEYEAGRETARECIGGLDVSCLRFAESGQFVSAVPAGIPPRTSLIRAVRAIHGTDALQRALEDTAGSVGARFARAAGVSEDSLVAEWRAWLLTAGGHPRVTADVGDGMPAIIFAALLLFAAARSGRWR